MTGNISYPKNLLLIYDVFLGDRKCSWRAGKSQDGKLRGRKFFFPSGDHVSVTKTAMMQVLLAVKGRFVKVDPEMVPIRSEGIPVLGVTSGSCVALIVFLVDPAPWTVTNRDPEIE